MNDTLKIKIGQMIMAGIPGGCVTESFAELCREYRIGNFCLSAENSTSLETVSDINYDLRGAIELEYDICVVGVFDAVSFPRQLEIIKALKEKGTSTIAVLLRSPYDYKFVKDCDAVITSYEYTPQAVSATVKAMKNNEYRGVLPIRLGGL